MTHSVPNSGRSFPIGVGTALLLLSGCTRAPSILDPQGPAAAHIANLWWLLFWMAMAVLIFVFAFLALALFRRRPAEIDSQRAQRAGTRVIILAGVVMPAIILAVVYAGTLWTLRALATPAIPEGLTIHVIGRLWWWEVQYPEQQFATANEIHIPVGQPVRIVLSSPNVIHSFWAPELHGKMDLVPGEINETWIQADTPGVYWGECAEFCGTQHAKMNFLVVAQPQAEYQAWLERQQQPVLSPTEPVQERLEKLWADPPGFFGWFQALQNDALGGRIVVVGFSFFVLAGLLALIMRVQLYRAENTFLSLDTYNELFTMHGSTMMFLFVVPVLEGFTIFLRPFMLGNREMPFPRLGQFSFFYLPARRHSLLWPLWDYGSVSVLRWSFC